MHHGSHTYTNARGDNVMRSQSQGRGGGGGSYQQGGRGGYQGQRPQGQQQMVSRGSRQCTLKLS